ncbi:MAG TPA: S46 family peptidase [Thermoanaerobaculia bacterium]
MIRAVVACVVVLAVVPLAADEGMWLFNAPPVRTLQERYGFTAKPQWLAHLQKSAIRMNVGGSASFVSADGLLLTNHHVGLDCIEKFSTAEHDYAKAGYLARTRAEEKKCADLEMNVLMSIEDVTPRVAGAVTPSMSAADADKARRAAMNTIEKESFDKTGLRSDVVTLFQGAEYQLYRYKKYTDVRLVFAPEASISFFGGDPDNFEYPRYDLDICFFRAYENDKPARVDHFLWMDPAGVKDGDLILIAGHPGGTDRMNSIADVRFLGDELFPFFLDFARRREVLLRAFSERNEENARRAHDELFFSENSRKAWIGYIDAAQDPAVMKKKAESEAALRRKVESDPELKQKYGDAWQTIERADAVFRSIFRQHALLESGVAFDRVLFRKARTLVRLAEENSKSNSERLREYRDSNRESVEQQLYSEAPVYDDLQTVELASGLSHLVEVLGLDDPLVLQVLAGRSPSARAYELVHGTNLKDVAFRKQLAAGGKAAIETSDDPMIRLARIVDPKSRELRTAYEQRVEEPLRQAYAKIARASFATSTGETYPDATFTLRLGFGTVKGFEEAGRSLPWRTTIGGAFTHAAEHSNQPPFDLPRSWLDAKPRLNLDTPMNFLSTVDTIGGNSGSPIVSRQGDFVGIFFDTNLEALGWDFVYDDRQGRAIAVDVRAILEALQQIYKADNILSELKQK